MSVTSNYISASDVVATVDTTLNPKVLFLPGVSSIYGKILTVKDVGGRAFQNNITIKTALFDYFEGIPARQEYIISNAYGSIQLLAKSNYWYFLNTGSGGGSVSIISDGIGGSNPGVSSLSSIVSYGLSTVYGGHGISSLSSIIAYGLSSVNGGEGISSLSSIVAYGLSSISGGEGISSLSSIVAYGLSSVNGGEGISSLSSIVAYGLSSIQSGLSSISSLKITTSSLHSLYISSGIADFSTISTQTILVGYVGSPLQVDIGVETPIIYASNIESYKGFFTGNVGIGRKAPYWYALDVLGNARFSGVISGDGSGLTNLNSSNFITFTPGVSSLSSIVAYGLSSLEKYVNLCNTAIYQYMTNNGFPGNNGPSVGSGSNPGVSSLSSIVAYGLSSLRSPNGISSLSSIVAYGLSSINTGPGISSLSSIVAYGLSSLHSPDGISSLSSIVAYGLSSVHSPDGISSLSSIVAYGLSSLHSPNGISSLSSIVAYGLSSLHSPDGISSLSSIVAYGLSSMHSPNGISSLSSIVAYGLSSVNGSVGISSLSSIVAYGLSSLEKYVNLCNTAIYQYMTDNGFPGNNGPSVGSGSNPGVSSLSSIVSYGLSSIQRGLSSISSLKITTSSLHSLYISSGIADFSTISTQTILVGYVNSPLQVDIGIETPIIYTSNIESYKGFFTGNVGIGRKAPYWYALDVLGNARFSGVISGDGGGLSNINVNKLLFTPGVSSLSSIVAYGLSTVYENAIKFIGNTSNQGVSSLSSIVSYGLSSVNAAVGVSSLSSIVAYGLSSINTGPGISSLSSIVAYGLSTVGLIQNPTVGPFIDASRGGAGISSLASLPKEAPDTITDAVAKIDNWLFKNIIAQPPIPVQCNSDIKGTFAKLPLVPPFQIKSGVLNQWLPAIFSIQADVYAKSNYSLISSIVLSNSTLLPKGESNFNGFYFDGQFVTACNISYFGYTNTGTSNLYYIPLGSNLKINASYQIDIYYRNHSMESVNILSNEWYILRGFQPAAPYDLVLSNPTYDSIYTGFTLSNIDCNNPSQGIGNGANYVDAFITLSNSITNPIPRRYGLEFTSYSQQFTVSLPSDATSNTYISCNIVGVPADTYLSFNVYTTNSLSQNDGLISSNSYYSNTPLPPDGGRLTSVTYNSGGDGNGIVPNYPVSGIPVNRPRTNVVQVLCNSVIIAQGGFSNIINNNRGLAIHTIETPGNSNTTPIASLQVTTATDSNTFFFTGWSDTLQSGGTSNSANSGIIVGAIQDVYSESQYLSNFYLQASNVSVVISNAYFTSAGANAIQFSIIGSNLSNANITYTSQTYYSDSLTGGPSLAQFSNALDLNNPGRFQYITGVLSLTSNVVFDFKADVANWACNFYPACNTFLRASYSRGVVGTSNLNSNTLIYNNTDSLAWTGSVPNPARFQLSNTSFAGFGTILTSNRDSQIVATLTVNTLTTSESVLRCNIPYYFDIASINRINSLLGGTRFLALSNTYPIVFTQFNNTCNITSNSANSYGYELPLLGGFYRSGCNLGVTYGNFTDFEIPKGFVGYEYPTSYANISNETGIRYAMFKYSLTNETSTHYVKLLQFNINSSVGFNNIGVNCNFDSRSISNLWYKIDNINSCNTGWLNGNSTRTTLASFNGLDANGNGIAGLRPNSFNTPINGVQRYFSIIPIAPSCNFDVYVKIGIKMNCNINFDYINISNIYGSNNPAPTGLNISYIGNIFDNNLRTTWTNRNITDLYTGLNSPILCNIGSLSNNIAQSGYPRSGNPIIPDTKTFVTFGTVNTYDFPTHASNYDTYYTLTLYTINDLGLTTNPSANSSSFTFKTPLPNNYPAFYTTGNTFEIDPNYLTNYPNNGSIYTNESTRRFVESVININETFTPDSSFGDFNSIYIQITNPDDNTIFTVNSEDNRVGSNLNKVVLYGTMCNGGTLLDTSKFTYFNGLYNEGLRDNIGSNGSNFLYLTNANDMWEGDIYRSNFFYSASGFRYVGFCNYIVACNTNYTFVMSNDQGCNIASPNYYFDNFPTAATAGISNIFVDTSQIDSTYYSYVSGLAVFNTNCNYNLWIAASNLGYNFFTSPPVTVRLVDGLNINILNYIFNSASSPLYSNSNTESIMTNTVQNSEGQTFLYWTDVNLANTYTSGSIFTVNNPFSNIGSASNLNGLSAAPTNFVFGDSSNRKFYFDSASVLIRDATKNSNYVSGALNYGLRVESGAGLYPEWFGACNVAIQNFGKVYENDSNISTSYSNELQLVNGVYTASNSLAYLNYSSYYVPTGYSEYPDYSSIYTDGRRRYTTFMWYINNSTVNNIYFIIKGNNFTSNYNSVQNFVSYTNNITLQYRLIDLANSPNYPLSVNNGTTAWLNANAYFDGNSTRSVFTSTNNKGGGINDASRSYYSSTETRLIKTSDSTGNTGQSPFLLYIRLGLPIQFNFNFSNIQLLNVY